MSWGRKLLDDDAFAEQEEAQAKAANPWGPLLDLPEERPLVDPAAVEAALASATDSEGDGETDPPPAVIGEQEPGQVTVETLKVLLAENPTLWDTHLALELQRAAPRKTALDALLNVMEAQGVDPETLAQVHELLEAQ